MDWLTSFVKWCSGGDAQYRTLFHCMRDDRFWIGLTVALDLLVASGYLLIALHWRRNQRALTNLRTHRALGRMKNIFFYCGLCGYLFIPVKLVWPAWRLYDGFMAVLVYFTWRYALDTRDLAVVYSELNRTKKLEDDLEVSRAESRRKSYFLNAVSHDLRTPLNGMILQADYAAMSLDQGDLPAAREALAETHRSARATAELLNSFLELARLDWAEEMSRPVEFDLAEVVRRVVANFDADARAKGLALTVTGAGPGGAATRAVPVVSDRTKIERIVLNLVSNALKFTEAGRVSVDVGPDGLGRARVDVTDTGIGIAAADQARLFEEFFQAHNVARDRSKGFGLGLSIARRLARQIGGDLTVSSAPGRGSTFSVTLPTTPTADGVSVPAPTPGGTEAGSTLEGDGPDDGQQQQQQQHDKPAPAITG